MTRDLIPSWQKLGLFSKIKMDWDLFIVIIYLLKINFYLVIIEGFKLETLLNTEFQLYDSWLHTRTTARFIEHSQNSKIQLKIAPKFSCQDSTRRGQFGSSASFVLQALRPNMVG